MYNNAFREYLGMIEIVVYVKRSTVSHYKKAIEILSVRNSPHLGQDI